MPFRQSAVSRTMESFLYEKDKSDRAARKKQKVIVVKEVKFSVTVDEHDYQTKKNQAVRFLGEGDKVKASLRFKGRQMAHRDLGLQHHQPSDPGHGRPSVSSNSCRAWKAQRCMPFLRQVRRQLPSKHRRRLQHPQFHLPQSLRRHIQRQYHRWLLLRPSRSRPAASLTGLFICFFCRSGHVPPRWPQR